MYRRCVSLLVIAGLVASQLAAIPHAHAAMNADEQREHGVTPHVHIGKGGHEHFHTHAREEHSHAGHSHDRHDSESNPPLADESGTSPLIHGLNRGEHDSTAIFVPIQTANPAGTKDQLTSGLLLNALAAIPDFVAAHQGSANSTPRWHPPDEVLDASSSYLTLRNLRI